MRPIVVWENAERGTARTMQTIPKTRVPFNGECIAASDRDRTFCSVRTRRTNRDWFSWRNELRFEDIPLTRATSQVVFWSDHQTAVPSSRDRRHSRSEEHTSELQS